MLYDTHENTGELVDPFGFSITLTTHETLLTPCKGCGNISPRVPYEVIDKHGSPVCLLCLKDFNHALFVLLDDYYERFGYVGFRQKAASGEAYEGMVGFITPEFQVDQRLNDFFAGLTEILYRYGIDLLYHTNIGYKKLEGGCFFRLEDRKYWEAVERAIKEYHDVHAEEGTRVMYYLIYNKAFFSRTFKIGQILPEPPTTRN